MKNKCSTFLVSKSNVHSKRFSAIGRRYINFQPRSLFESTKINPKSKVALWILLNPKSGRSRMRKEKVSLGQFLLFRMLFHLLTHKIGWLVKDEMTEWFLINDGMIFCQTIESLIFSIEALSFLTRIISSLHQILVVKNSRAPLFASRITD